MSPPEPQAGAPAWPDTTGPIPSLYLRETETVWSSCTTSWCVQLHETTQKHSSSTPPLETFKFLKLPPRHNHLPQKHGGAQTGPGQIRDISSLNCSSMSLPGLHGQWWGCSSHPGPRSQPCPQLPPHTRESKTINLLAENTNSYWACAITGLLSSYSRYADPMLHFHPAPTPSSSINRAHAVLLYMGKSLLYFT